jgi:type I restriction enzyme R subunit
MKPSEHKTVQARILAYSQEIGWSFVPREEAEERRAGFPTRQSGEIAGRNAHAQEIGWSFVPHEEAEERRAGFPTRQSGEIAGRNAHAQEIGWSFVPREEAEERRAGFPTRQSGEIAGRNAHAPLSLFFDDLLDAKVREFNPRYTEAEGALLGQFRHFHSDIYGNRDFVEHLRNRGKFFDHEEKRERDLILIDYVEPANNVYEVTEEWAFHNGHFGTREDIVFLVNGIPVLVIECKNASKDEAIALGVDQIRRYHRETPELFVSQQLFTATDAIGFSYGVSWNTVRRNIFKWKVKGERVSQPVDSIIGEITEMKQPVDSKCGATIGIKQPVDSIIGEITDRNVRAPFFNPEAETDKHRRNLPHWQQSEVWVFVTWRLGDSLPRVKLDEWKEERAIWLLNHPEPWDETTEAEYHDHFSKQIDEWLDQGSGSCLLKESVNAQIVADALRYFDGKRYQLASFVVMPNHVHVLFQPLGEHSLADIVRSWKGFTAREINKRIGKQGSLWQEEYWDRLIRSERHFFRVVQYIRENPKGKPLHFPIYFESTSLFEGNRGLGSPLSHDDESWSGGVGNGLGYPFPGRLEAKVKSFCAIPQVLASLEEYILFAEKDEELNKYILRQHQTGAVERVVRRALDLLRRRGLVWHTQGSGKTFTMIKAAELLFRAPDAEKPTVLLMIDRNELEDQMLKNLAALGLGNLEHATSITRLNKLLRDDYRGIIVTMIHKFRDMPQNINIRSNIYVLIDEAHRTTGGDLGNFLMAGLPNASYIGFTGTPVDKTVYGKGTFKTFGCEDDKGYLHKYSIAESISDGTTLPLYYTLAPNEMLVPHETLDKEFLSLAEAEGVADIEELNRILERAVNLKNFLKGKERIENVARFVAEHYRENVEPLGYKAFLVGVDREACALYKHALDEFLPSEYSEVVYTGNNNDSALLKEFHLDPKRERQIRKSFSKLDQQPKILIVTEKLLTGFDAPVLYAIYLDKPMRDHTLLQAIARVNRPYENERLEMVKPHGFVLDFVGIFDKLEKALAFDSEEVNAIVKDLKLLKVLFQSKMEQEAPGYLGLIERNFDDRDVDTLIEHFRDPDRRKVFFKEYKEIEMLYEIISPDAFLRPFIDDYSTLSAVYAVVRNAYSRRIQVDRAFQRKTSELVQKYVGTGYIQPVSETVEINEETIKYITERKGGGGKKVINLVKSIEKIAEDESDDPYLIAMAERAQAVQDSFESRQTSTAEALDKLLREVEANETRKREQAEKGFDGLTYFVYRTLLDAEIDNPEEVSRRIRQAFIEFADWKKSEKTQRELRKQVTFAVLSQSDNLEQVTLFVEQLFTLLDKANRI